jgi:DNA polymerase-3 subunit epsilon
MIEVILDTETTGLSIDKDRVVEIACIELQNHLPTKNIFHKYINPEDTRVTPGAFETHGYTDQFLSTKPKFREIVKEFTDFIKDKKLIIHNADFDVGILNHELKRLNLPPIKKEQVIDTLNIAREKFPGSTSNNLNALCKKFKIDISEREKHTALLDCQLLAKVYIELIGARELSLNLNTNSEIYSQKNKTIESSGIVINITEDQKEEYIKFLKKNVSNAFALEKK